MSGFEVQFSVPVEEVVKESPLGAVKVTTPVKGLTQEPAPVGPAPLPENSPRGHRYPARVTEQTVLEEVKVQEKCPRKAPAKVIEDRAETGATVDREDKARRTTGIKNRALGATLNLNLAKNRPTLFSHGPFRRFRFQNLDFPNLSGFGGSRHRQRARPSSGLDLAGWIAAMNFERPERILRFSMAT